MCSTLLHFPKRILDLDTSTLECTDVSGTHTHVSFTMTEPVLLQKAGLTASASVVDVEKTPSLRLSTRDTFQMETRITSVRSSS
jgi:hypothetical protein